MHPITVYSFGYLHPMPEDLPPFDITVDLRRLLADPAHVLPEEKRDMTGLDDEVRQFVFRTPGAYTLVHNTMNLTSTARLLNPTAVAFGCAGGRHRSVACAEKLTWLLRGVGYDIKPVHLHVYLPRVIRGEPGPEEVGRLVSSRYTKEG